MIELEATVEYYNDHSFHCLIQVWNIKHHRELILSKYRTAELFELSRSHRIKAKAMPCHLFKSYTHVRK